MTTNIMGFVKEHPAAVIGGGIVLFAGAYYLFGGFSSGSVAVSSNPNTAAYLGYQAQTNATNASLTAQTNDLSAKLQAQTSGQDFQLALAKVQSSTSGDTIAAQLQVALAGITKASGDTAASLQVALDTNAKNANVQTSGFAAQLAALQLTTNQATNQATIAANEATTIAHEQAGVSLAQITATSAESTNALKTQEDIANIAANEQSAINANNNATTTNIAAFTTAATLKLADLQATTAQMQIASTENIAGLSAYVAALNSNNMASVAITQSNNTAAVGLDQINTLGSVFKAKIAADQNVGIVNAVTGFLGKVL